MQVASVGMPERGYLIDYSLMSQQNGAFTFENGETYLVSTNITFSGEVTIQGAVVKFLKGGSASLTFNGPVD